MSLLVAEPERPPTLLEVADEGRSLEDVIGAAWAGLCAGCAVVCPVCGGALMPRIGAGAAPVGGRCSSCRSELA